jgi:hypothetical protein
VRAIQTCLRIAEREAIGLMPNRSLVHCQSFQGYKPIKGIPVTLAYLRYFSFRSAILQKFFDKDFLAR